MILLLPDFRIIEVAKNEDGGTGQRGLPRQAVEDLSQHRYGAIDYNVFLR